MLAALGFRRFDQYLLVLCPLFSVLGSVTHALMVQHNFLRLPRLKKRYQNASLSDTSRQWLATLYWLVARCFLGLSIGLLVALYFTGDLEAKPLSASKLLALSLAAGYLAPKFFALQEKRFAASSEET